MVVSPAYIFTSPVRLMIRFVATLVLIVATSLCMSGCTRIADEDTAHISLQDNGQSVVRTINADEAHDMMVSNRVAILDVRTQEEYDALHIVNARLLPLDDVDEASSGMIAPHKEEPVFVYCRTGQRSKEAAQKLCSFGYKQVYDFGGIQSWPYKTIGSSSEDFEKDFVENDQLPVGVKVVCGQTKSIPE